MAGYSHAEGVSALVDSEIFYLSRSQKPYGALSNFEYSPIVIASKSYATVEHWYQASKAVSEDDHESIRLSASPEEAKLKGHTIPCKPGWDDIRLGIMYRGMLAKFQQNAPLKDVLLSTLGKGLHEASHDNFWGWDEGNGEDWCGQLLATIRYQLVNRDGVFPRGKVRDRLAGSFPVGFAVAAKIRETRDRNGAWFSHIIRDDHADPPLEILSAILRTSRLLPASRPGYEPAISFTTAPLSGLSERCFGAERRLRREQLAHTRSGFGIAIPFTLGRELGVVPVLPVSLGEARLLPPQLQYRVQHYSAAEQYDWTHEDEWRFPSELQLSPSHATVLVPDEPARVTLRARFGDAWHIETVTGLAGP
jgi:N-glycosidase YbiA